MRTCVVVIVGGAALGCAMLAASAGAAVVITEVHPTGSSASYAADFFELTNTGSSDVDITGWKMDDSSAAFATSVALRNITSIPAGASVIFFEGNASGSTDATIAANFISAWFGGSAPSSFLIGAYGGSGVGLSSTSDGVAIFDASGTLVTSVTSGLATSGRTFDNASGASGAISTLSAVGVNGAFTSTIGEVGSPGLVPTPGAFGLFGAGMLAAVRRRR